MYGHSLAARSSFWLQRDSWIHPCQGLGTWRNALVQSEPIQVHQSDLNLLWHCQAIGHLVSTTIKVHSSNIWWSYVITDNTWPITIEWLCSSVVNWININDYIAVNIYNIIMVIFHSKSFHAANWIYLFQLNSVNDQQCNKTVVGNVKYCMKKFILYRQWHSHMTVLPIPILVH